MTFVADRRGRVPFAFIGAVLLLTSSLYAASVAPPATTEPIAEEVGSDAQIEARLALDTAIRDADRAAAAEPVLDPSPRGLGRALPENDTFEHALELRIAGAAETALQEVEAGRGGVQATVSLPPIRDHESARAALERVSIEPVTPDRYRVTIRDLRVTVTRHDRPIDRFRYNETITMELPSLSLHDRTSRYEKRLNAGLAQPGLARDLTARLFPIVWARGYAQYGGAPIQNVLANRHVELMANDAALAQQAAVFGQADPAGRRGVSVAAMDVATRDAFAGAEEMLKSQVSKPRGDQTGAGEIEGTPSVSLPSVVDNEQSVDANHTADEAFLDYLAGREGPDLESTVDDIYRADVRVETRSRPIDTERVAAEPPPSNGTYLGRTLHTDKWVADGHWESGHGSTLRTYEGQVIEERRVTKWWVQNGSLALTEEVDHTAHAVELTLSCRYQPPGIAPDRPGDRCPFGAEVREQLAADGSDRLLSGSELSNRALAAVEGDGESGWEPIDLDPPETVRNRAQQETGELRRTVRDISVSVETRSVASSTNPARKLRKAIADRRASLLETPASYDSAADRAVAATRQTYLDRLTDRLGDRTPKVQQAQAAFSDQLQAHAIPSEPPERSSPTRAPYVAGVDAGPAYLSADPPSETDPSIDVRNVNLFTVPYGDAADAVTEQVEGVGSRGVSLRTAAQTLAAVESRDSVSGREVRALRRGIEDSVASATARYRSVLEAELGSHEADRVVTTATNRYPDTASRALAITDGRLARAIGDSLPAGLPSHERDRLRVALRVAGTEIQSESEVQVSQDLVEKARVAVESGSNPVVSETAKAAGEKVGTAAWEKATDSSVATLPAGLPLLPMPGSWYATANAWTVSVRGSYEQVSVHTRRATPARAENGTVEYVREDVPVRLDLDRDGHPDRLGSNRAIDFEAQTGVVIVVPPGKTGVGDRGGDAIEESPGW
ncbi:hypothetical protein RH831_06170 [Halodesulfurarchaeum sp. HSR-GB]|uniref:DUF7286 family protein n=1 Tax=Halodesulfurarchaeum sp. HSR-GB TaxID=3074077 RepID=UPI0028625241|nr:hypothetical protein [Halodesulfurarchaeum sp. HSR-GB]MDR5656763.1 hypothetical protein [Halodesulfurarchaeum sp. HSR-GB]